METNNLPVKNSEAGIHEIELNNTLVASSLTIQEKQVFDAAGIIPLHGYANYQAAYKEVKIICGKVCLANGATLPEALLEPVLYEWVIKFYGDLTVKEIELAFDMNAAGQLDEVAQHFNSFDKMFIGTVLNKYRKHKLKLLDKYKKPELPPPPKTVTEQDIIESLKVIVKDLNRFKQDPTCRIDAVKFKVKLLEDRGILKISVAEKWEWYHKATLKHAANIKSAIAERTTVFTSLLMEIIKKCEAGEAPASEDNKIKGIAREMALRHYFAKWDAEGFDLGKALIK